MFSSGSRCASLKNNYSFSQNPDITSLFLDSRSPSPSKILQVEMYLYKTLYGQCVKGFWSCFLLVAVEDSILKVFFSAANPSVLLSETSTTLSNTTLLTLAPNCRGPWCPGVTAENLLNFAWPQQESEDLQHLLNPAFSQ